MIELMAVILVAALAVMSVLLWRVQCSATRWRNQSGFFEARYLETVELLGRTTLALATEQNRRKKLNSEIARMGIRRNQGDGVVPSWARRDRKGPQW